MNIISRGRAIVEVGVVAAIVGGVAFNLFGCSAGSTTYGNSKTANGSSGVTVTGGTSSTSSTSVVTGTCAATYSPSYANLWVSGTNGVWSHTPIKIYFATSDITVPTGATTTASYESQVLAGFGEWGAGGLSSGPNYTVVSSASAADVTISFAWDGNSTSTAAWSGSGTGTNSIFKSQTVTFTASSNGTILASALQLEGAQAFGYILGLPASTSGSDITNRNTTASVPSQSDINTAKNLYCSYYP